MTAAGYRRPDTGPGPGKPSDRLPADPARAEMTAGDFPNSRFDWVGP
jgi:hypothetical protein